jgi:hypothetical protein
MKTTAFFTMAAAFFGIALTVTAAPTVASDLETREPKELVKDLGFTWGCIENVDGNTASFCSLECPCYASVRMMNRWMNEYEGWKLKLEAKNCI